MTLSAQTVTTDISELTLSAQTSSATFMIGAAYDVVALSGTVQAIGEVRSGGVVVENTTVMDASSLSVEIVPREFGLSFAAPEGGSISMARVPAERPVGIAVVLDNPALLLAGETVRLTLSAQTVTTDISELTLSAQTSSATFMIGAASDRVSLPGMVDVSGGVFSGEAAVVNTRVLPASLPVEIVPREFTLSFAAPGGGVDFGWRVDFDGAGAGGEHHRGGGGVG